MNELVVDLEHLASSDLPLAGGKGASLGELTRLGLPVPPGFVVTTTAFRLVSGELARAQEDLERLSGDDRDAVAAAATGLRAQLSKAPLGAELEEAILERFGALGAGRDGLAVAVRSSATSEDSAEASFAGLQDTYLWVRTPEGLLERVRDCWASLYSVESLSYRRQRAIAEREVAMAVVVQEMVDARSAGVLFTRSPRSGDRSVVAIDAAWGLGSAVVGGEVTPDAFTINKVTGEIVHRQISEKLRRHMPDPEGAGTRDEAVPDELQRQPSVSDAELARLVALGCAAEAHYGVAQDIEWAIAAERPEGDDLFLLQSRPETAWSSKKTEPVAQPKARAFDHVIEAMARR